MIGRTSPVGSTVRPNISPASVTNGVRAWVLAMGIAATVLGAWAFLSPESFFVDFPVDGAGWVSTLGEFNDHLTRDYGSAQVGLGVAATVVGLSRSRSGVVAVMSGLVVFGIPHLGYHLTTFSSFTPVSAAAQALALTLFIVIPLAVLRAVLFQARKEQTR
jgi:hypothetical protein